MVLSCLFLGSESVWYHDGNQKIFFERNHLDETLSKSLLELIKTNNTQEIVVVTWPWWFTNLRVGSLVCNLIAHYVPTVSFRVVSKIQCYKRCIDNAILPAHWLVYIGQKKTVWDYDFASDTYTLISKDTVVDDTYFIEWVDGYYDKIDEKKHVLFDIDGWLYLQYWWEKHYLDKLLANISVSRIVEPSYYVQPVIG